MKLKDEACGLKRKGWNGEEYDEPRYLVLNNPHPFTTET
jgi:hypothetical protein